MTFTPSRHLLGDTIEEHASSPTVLGPGLLYLLRDPARLVFEDASGTSERPLDVTLTYPGHATPGSSASGGWKVFVLGGSSELDARYLAIHFATGVTREFRLSPPEGLELPGGYSSPPPIDARGRLLVTLSDGQRIHLQATENGLAWEPVGRPISAGGYPTTVKEVGGAVIFEGGGGGAEIPGALPAGASQLVGPQGGEGIELVRSDPGAPDNPVYADDAISGDGACVAYFRSGSLRVVETDTYASSDLGLFADGHSAEMAWIPLPD